MTDPVWRVAGRYRVVGRIGAGGMADVLRAHDELLNRDVAVKVFRSTPTTPDTASGVERQHAELHALARLNHPNLTVLYDGSIVGQDGPAYLVMELIEGPSLAQRIDNGAMSEPQVRLMGAQIADALAYVHNAGMVHRDVKPANILLGEDGAADAGGLRARLTDFGIVRLVGNEPLTQVDMTLGSASYLAPEQARGSAVGPAADVYALGLTLIEALTGVRAFDGPPLEAVVARLSSDPEIPASLPEPWPQLLAGMTARDAGARPTATRVAQILRGAESPTTAFARGPAGAPLAAALVTAPVTAPATALPPRANQTAYLPPVAAAASYPTNRGSASRPSVAGPPQYPAGPARSRLPWLIAGIVAVLALIAVGAVLLATSGSGGSGTAPSTGASSPVTKSSTKKTPSSAAATTPSRSRSASSTAPDTSAPATSPSTSPSSASSPPSTAASSPSKTPSASTSSASASNTAPSKTVTSSKPAGKSSSSSTAAAS